MGWGQNGRRTEGRYCLSPIGRQTPRCRKEHAGAKGCYSFDREARGVDQGNPLEEVFLDLQFGGREAPCAECLLVDNHLSK